VGQGAPPIVAWANFLPVSFLPWSPPRALLLARPRATPAPRLIQRPCTPRVRQGCNPAFLAASWARRRVATVVACQSVVATVGRLVPTHETIAALRGGCVVLAVRRLPARPVTRCLPSWGGMEEVRREAEATLGGATGVGASTPAAVRQRWRHAARRSPAAVGSVRESVVVRSVLRGCPDDPRRPPLLL
jgi:hypothetical protein